MDIKTDDREILDLLIQSLKDREQELASASKGIREIETLKKQVNLCRWLLIGSLSLSGLTFVMNGFWLEGFRQETKGIKEAIQNAPQLATRATCKTTDPNLFQMIFQKQTPTTECNSETTPQ